MNQLRMAVVIGCSLFTFSVAEAKGVITRIVIEGDNLPAAIEINEPQILEQFSIWNGPGVGMRDPSKTPDLTKYVDNGRPNGRFIDWPRGFAEARPGELQRLEVTFFVSIPRRPDETRKFIFAYEVDWEGSQGFIFLPNWKNSLIWHGVELNWLYAHERWDQAIMPLVAKYSDSGVGPADLPCSVGRGALDTDGTVEFQLIDEDGDALSHWTYETSTEGYEKVREHIGDVETGRGIDISCWPSRD